MNWGWVKYDPKLGGPQHARGAICLTWSDLQWTWNFKPSDWSNERYKWESWSDSATVPWIVTVRKRSTTSYGRRQWISHYIYSNGAMVLEIDPTHYQIDYTNSCHCPKAGLAWKNFPPSGVTPKEGDHFVLGSPTTWHSPGQNRIHLQREILNIWHPDQNNTGNGCWLWLPRCGSLHKFIATAKHSNMLQFRPETISSVAVQHSQLWTAYCIQQSVHPMHHSISPVEHR